MKTAPEIANQIFTEHYLILFDSNSDLSEEILITILAKKHALKTVQFIIDKGIDTLFWLQVKLELLKI
jgi:hypothetical protein